MNLQHPSSSEINESAMTEGRALLHQHAIVTGGGSGIGAAIAKRLYKSGAYVTLIGRNWQKLNDVLNEMTAKTSGRSQESSVRVHALTADVSDEKAIESAVKTAVNNFGDVTILINNAGTVSPSKLHLMSLDTFQQTINVNLTGTFLCTRSVLPQMIKSKAGRIVNIASTAALKGYAYVSAYSAAKHGVLGLTRALALEVAELGISVNAICPGYTDTEIVRDAIDRIQNKTGRSKSEALNELTKTNPQGRLITPDEIAETVIWLCSPAARSVTGQAITIAGGEVM